MLVPTTAAPSLEGAACARLPAAPRLLARLAARLVRETRRTGMAVVLVAVAPARFAVAGHVRPVAVPATCRRLVGVGQGAAQSETTDHQRRCRDPFLSAHQGGTSVVGSRRGTHRLRPMKPSFRRFSRNV